MSARFSLGFAGLVTTGALLLLAVNFYGGDSGFTRPRGSSVLEAGTAANQIPLVNSLDLPSVRAEGADWREKTTVFNPYRGRNPATDGSLAYAFSVTPQCDQSINMLNIRRILKLTEFWKSAAFKTALYQEQSWIGAQVGFFLGQVLNLDPGCQSLRVN